jgi:hypothetical protein
MTDWNGTAWVQDADVQTRAKDGRVARWAATGAMLVIAVLLIVPFAGAFAASHGGTGSGCSVNPSAADVGETYVVHAWGLSTKTAINLWVTEDGVTTGEPIGGTTDGTFSISRASHTPGVTTYTFSGPTGKGMKIYGSCSVSAY